MKKNRVTPAWTVEVKREQGEFTLQGECVLCWELTWPECSGGGHGVKNVAAYYRRHTELWCSRWKRELYTLACLDLAQRRAEGKPFRPWQVRLTTCITRQEDGLLSLWQEAVERWGFERPLVHRMGDTWSLPDGVPRSLAAFFPGQKRWKKSVLAKVERQVEERLNSGLSLLDSDCAARLKKEFDPRRFYVTEQGIEVFYPLYVLGAGAEGIPVFSVVPDGK